MIVLGLDPGSSESAIVAWNGELGRPVERVRVANAEIPAHLAELARTYESPLRTLLVIEQTKGYTLPGGRNGRFVPEQLLETCEWVGYFRRCWVQLGGRVEKLDRRAVKLHLLGRASGTDAHVRAALVDLIGPPGSKRAPGPTHGIRSDQWAALAVAYTWGDLAARPSRLASPTLRDADAGEE